MRQNKAFFIFLFFIFLPVTCFAEKQWKKDLNDVYIWTDISEPFSWKGDSIGYAYKLGNGKGVIESQNNKQRSKKIELDFGAEGNDFKTNNDKTIKYLCNGKGLNGFGLVSKNGQTYVGEFNNNSLNKKGDIYNGDFLVYSGELKSNTAHGSGIEFSKDGTSKAGTFKNGIKDGRFVIKTSSGKKVELDYKNNFPDRNNCFITYIDGSKWQGAVDNNFEPSNGNFIDVKGNAREEKRINGVLSGTQKITYSNGSVYDGEFLNGKRNGFGTMSFSNGIEYTGDWKNDYQCGNGIVTISKDSYYDGNWDYIPELKKSSPNGQGILATADSFYDGNWKKGKKDGYGFYQTEQFYYEGYWVNDEISGNGLLVFSNGASYEGSFSHSKRNGYGIYTWSDGKTYDGNWINDVPEGNGTCSLSSGESYTGDFASGMFNGIGTYLYSDGSIYEGSFVNNKKEGIGTYTFKNGDFYTGEFVNNKPNGKGIYNFTDGNYYEGNFKDGRFFGEGTLYIHTGNDYCLLTSKSWTGNSFPSYGDYYFQNGDCYSGLLENGKPSSQGIWTTAEDRLNNRTAVERYNDLYKEHKETINKGIDIAKYIIGVVQLSPIVLIPAATVCTFIPGAQPVAVGLVSVSTVIISKTLLLSAAGMAITGAKIVMNTASNVIDYKSAYDAKDAELMQSLRQQWWNENKFDLRFLAIESASFVGPKLKLLPSVSQKILNNPAIKKIGSKLSKMGEIPAVVKSGKFLKETKLVKKSKAFISRYVAISTYGVPATKLISKYGDDIARAIFKNGDDFIKIALSNSDEVVRQIRRYGDDAVKLVSQYADDGYKIISRHGQNGIKLLNNYGPELTKAYNKAGDLGIDLIIRCGLKRQSSAIKIINSSYCDTFLKTAKIARKSDYKLLVDFLDVFEDKGAYVLQNNAFVLPKQFTSQVIKDARKNQLLRTNFENFVESGAQFLDSSELYLKPNICYRTGEGKYYYKTDDMGRITNFEGAELHHKSYWGRTTRLENRKDTPMKMEGDNAGHIFADEFGGSPKNDNLLSQNGELNRGHGVYKGKESYKSMEKKIHEALNKNSEVSMEGTVLYDGNSLRPSRYENIVTIDGDVQIFNFDNLPD